MLEEFDSYSLVIYKITKLIVLLVLPMAMTGMALINRGTFWVTHGGTKTILIVQRLDNLKISYRHKIADCQLINVNYFKRPQMKAHAILARTG